MFIAALFSIAKTWKQPTCLATDEWITKSRYMYTMEYYSAIIMALNSSGETFPFDVKNEAYTLFMILER